MFFRESRRHYTFSFTVTSHSRWQIFLSPTMQPVDDGAIAPIDALIFDGRPSLPPVSKELPLNDGLLSCKKILAGQCDSQDIDVSQLRLPHGAAADIRPDGVLKGCPNSAKSARTRYEVKRTVSVNLLAIVQQ